MTSVRERARHAARWLADGDPDHGHPTERAGSLNVPSDDHTAERGGET
jgi:hypothetical protein